MSDWAKPGVEVVERMGGFSTSYGRIFKIGKVYANGNFILEGESRQQYSPTGYETAYATGDRDRWSRRHLRLVTHELRADIAKSQQVEKARAALAAEAKRLDTISRENDDEAILAEAQRLMAETSGANQRNKMTQALAERADQAPATVEQHPASDSTALIQMIERVARDPSIDMDKMERLLQMQERIMSRNAEEVFNSAMNEAQAEMTRVAADANNPQTKSKYASYGKLDAALRPIYTKHGFALSFDTGTDAPAECIRVLARVTKGGFTRTYHADMPADGKGAKGGDVMTKTHATGAAMSYGMRYLLKMIFNVAVGDEDRDGNKVEEGDDGSVITDEQRTTILKLIEEVGGDVAIFCKYYKIEAVPDLPARLYERAVRSLELKRGVKK